MSARACLRACASLRLFVWIWLIQCSTPRLHFVEKVLAILAILQFDEVSVRGKRVLLSKQYIRARTWTPLVHWHLPNGEPLDFYLPRVTPYLPCPWHPDDYPCLVCFDRDPVAGVARFDLDINIANVAIVRQGRRYGLRFLVDVHVGEEIVILDCDEPLAAVGDVYQTDPRWNGIFPLG